MAVTASLESDLLHAVRTAIDNAIEQIVDDEVAAAKDRIERRVREKIATVAVSAARVANIEYSGGMLVIQIRDERKGAQ